MLYNSIFIHVYTVFSLSFGEHEVRRFLQFFFFFDCLKNTAFTEKGENEDPDGHIAYKLETLLRML